MKKITLFHFVATAFLIAVFTLGLSAQAIWNADAVGGTVNWNTASNWIGGVPDATKTVTIYTCNTCPRINTTGNQSKFVQVYAGGELTIGVGGELTIQNPGGPGLKTHATSQVNVNQGGSLAIQNFWGEGLAIGGMLQNSGTISINGGHTGIAVSAGASFTNNINGTTTVTGYSLNYAMTSSGTVMNNGMLSLDDANNDGINQPVGTFTNGVNGTLNITKTGVNGIFSKGTFNNNGTLNIENGLNGIYAIFSNFNNNAGGKLNISGSMFLNTGIYVNPGTFKNAGEISIQQALSKGIEISSGSTFNNFGKITLNVPAWAGIFNVGGANFTNKACAVIASNAPIVNYANFINNGSITAPGSSWTTITINNGTLQGAFLVASGNTPVALSGALVWTGCLNSDWNNTGNWLGNIVPTNSNNYIAVVQNVSLASGNFPVVTGTAGTARLILDQNAELKVASGGTFSVATASFPGGGLMEVYPGANLRVMAGGKLICINAKLDGNLENAGIVEVFAPFHSVGSFTMNNGIFNNLSGGQFNPGIGQYGAGVLVRMDNSSVFNNGGSVTIDGAGGFVLDHSSLVNQSSGTMSISTSGFPYGVIENKGNSTCENAGTLAVAGSVKNESSDFQNSGLMNITYSPASGILNNNGAFNNTGTLNISETGLHGVENIHGGSFDNSGFLNLSSITQEGVQMEAGTTFNNLSGGHLTVNGAGAAGITTSGSVTNAGTMTMTDLGFAGIGTFGMEKFTNTSTGIITIDNAEDGIGANTPFENAGSIVISNIRFRGFTVTSTSSMDNKAGGTIHISHTTDIGFANFGSASNSGTITIENIPTDDGFTTGNFFHNNPSGYIIVRDVGQAGFWNFAGTTINEGEIIAERTGFSTISNYDKFENRPGGFLYGVDATGNGIHNLGFFQNRGYVIIDNPAIEGIKNENYKFENDETGTIEIYDVLNRPAIFTTNGFFNSGNINTFNAPTAIQVEPSGYFNNHRCAYISVDGMVDNRNVINNEGFFRTIFSGTNTGSGNFNNHAIVEDFYGSFTGVNFNNLAVRARPINGSVGGFIQNALELGGALPFQIGTFWYQDFNLTMPAGSYNQGVNSFTPTMGVGTHTLYFSAKNLVFNCTETVAVQVNISSALVRIKGEDTPGITLYNYPNPFGDNTRINLSLPFDSNGKLVVYDNFGRLVEELYDGDIVKDELYQFGFDASNRQVSSYLATLILQDGRTFPVRLVKADN